HQLAAEKAGDTTGQGAARPEEMPLGGNGGAAQIEFAVARQTGAPAPRHIRQRVACAVQLHVQRVFQAAVDDALGGKRLTGSQGMTLEQKRAVAGPAQPREQPEAGYAATEDRDI